MDGGASSPEQSRWMIVFGRVVIGIAAIFLMWHFLSSRISARLSFGKDDAVVGSDPQSMGIPGRSDPTGRWDRPSHKTKNLG
jgi:hypothetical protein